jgi:hypothetical protein
MAKNTQSETTENTTIRRVTDEEKTLYATIEEAQDNKPDRPSWSLFQITDPKGRQRFAWGPFGERVLWWAVVEADKAYSVLSTADAPSKTDVAGFLAALSTKDRDELLKQFAGKK